MLKKIFGIARHLILSIPLICAISFFGWNSAVDALSPASNGDNPLKIVIEPTEEKQSADKGNSEDRLNMGSIPDLGDDQVFPFVAGLDSYEGSKK